MHAHNKKILKIKKSATQGLGLTVFGCKGTESPRGTLVGGERAPGCLAISLLGPQCPPGGALDHVN